MGVLDKIKAIAPKASQFAWDGCHRLYILNTVEDVMEAHTLAWQVFNIDKDLQRILDTIYGSIRIGFWSSDEIF